VAQSCANTADFVSGDAGAHACPAYKDAALCSPGKDLAADFLCYIRKIDRLFAVRAAVSHRVTPGPEGGDDVPLQRETCVIASDCKGHPGGRRRGAGCGCRRCKKAAPLYILLSHGLYRMHASDACQVLRRRTPGSIVRAEITAMLQTTNPLDRFGRAEAA
jgi:hypothetical protein